MKFGLVRNLAAVSLSAAALLGCHDDGPISQGGPLALSVLGGDGQKGPAGSTLPIPLRVQVTHNGEPVTGQRVTWDVVTGQAALANASATDADGVSSTVVQLGAAGTKTIRARVDADVATFTLTALPVTATDPVRVSETPIPPDYGIHDTFVRDGIAFVFAWNTGVIIYDVGDGRKGGSPSKPEEISRLITADDGVPGGPAVHNGWWFHNPVTQERRYLFIGQEGPGVLTSTSSGDIHVVDVADLAQPAEVAFLAIPGAGAHNFWMDEARQVLYAAYYNAGVIAVDVSGTLSGNLSSRIIARVTPGGPNNTYAWGVQLAQGALWVSDIVSGFWKLDPVSLATLGGGDNVPDRWGSDLWVNGQYAYTGTWGGSPRGSVPGNAIKIWRTGGAAPNLADSIIIANIRTVSDLQVSDDGRLLAATAEGQGGAGLYVFNLSDPVRPTRRGFAPVAAGLHTGTVARIGGRLYDFAARNPGSTSNPALEVYDITP